MPLLELRNMVTTARLIVLALKRKESRGLHYTTDYPEQNDRYWKKDTYPLERQVHESRYTICDSFNSGCIFH